MPIAQKLPGNLSYILTIYKNCPLRFPRWFPVVFVSNQIFPLLKILKQKKVCTSSLHSKIGSKRLFEGWFSFADVILGLRICETHLLITSLGYIGPANVRQGLKWLL